MLDRRRLLIANSQGGGDGYVTDGLVLFLDGLNQGNVTDKWVDLIGGKEFSISGNHIINNDSITLNSGFIYNDENVPFQTVEIVYQDNQSSFHAFFSANSNSVYNINFNTPTVLQFGSENANPKIVVPTGEKVSISACYDNGYNSIKVNGETATNSSTSDRWTGFCNNGIYLGVYYNNRYKFVGDFFALRLYNRQLTAEEQYANYLVDKQRYGL